ncbi:MAG: hypothetical protein HZB99_00450 [Candidatus Harrisonbacteria bacterium]|nr:hypothetical protein [Candidatus Harrisonbacteria bacterium]
MIKIVGNDIFKNGQKIGWVQSDDIYDSSGRKLGYYSGNDIYNRSGTKIAYVEGGSIKRENGSTISVEQNRLRITGGNYSDICRAAIRLLFGD